MPNQIPEQVKAARVNELANLEADLRRRYFHQLIGRQLRVLVESPVKERPGRMVGTSCRYAPVELPGTVAMRRQFADVIAGEVREDRILAAE